MSATTWPVIAAAATLGVAGSAHCLGMCGGIAAAAGTQLGHGSIPGSRALAGLSFNLGRIVGYALLGAVAGAIIGATAGRFPVGPVTAGLRIAAAVLMAGLALSLLLRRDLLGLERLGGRLWRRLQPLTGRARSLPGHLGLVTLGALWGFLPCGLVYSALALAGASGSGAGGALTMLAFGLGTLPSMVAATLAGVGLLRRLSGARTRILAGMLMLLFAFWTAAGPLAHLRAMSQDAPAGAPHRQHGSISVAPDQRIARSGPSGAVPRGGAGLSAHGRPSTRHSCLRLCA